MGVPGFLGINGIPVSMYTVAFFKSPSRFCPELRHFGLRDILCCTSMLRVKYWGVEGGGLKGSDHTQLVLTSGPRSP
jgi:hypothetical protein